MIVLIHDHFDYYIMQIDLTEICKIYGHKTLINGKLVTDYPYQRCRRMLNKIANAILWDICEEEPNDISNFLYKNNKKVAEIWETIRKKYGI